MTVYLDQERTTAEARRVLRARQGHLSMGRERTTAEARRVLRARRGHLRMGRDA